MSHAIDDPLDGPDFPFALFLERIAYVRQRIADAAPHAAVVAADLGALVDAAAELPDDLMGAGWQATGAHGPVAAHWLHLGLHPKRRNAKGVSSITLLTP